jgi:hypothetical protein
MDKSLTDAEAARLNAHMRECADCMADFLIYDEMITGFDETGLIPAPDGFQEAVLEKVSVCGKTYSRRDALAEKVLGAVWTAAALILGVALLVVSSRDQLLALMAGSGYAEWLAPYASFVANVSVVVSAELTRVFEIVGAFVAEYSVALSIAAGAVAVAYAAFMLEEFVNQAKFEEVCVNQAKFAGEGGERPGGDA